MREVRSVTAPMKFFIDKGLFGDLPEHTKTLGKKPYIIADPFIFERADKELSKAFDQSEIVEFGGENSISEIDKNVEKAKEAGADFVIGIGGGKTMDNAKAVGYEAGIRVAIMPTLASSDAPATSLSVRYTDEGEFDQYLYLPNNPDIVLADLDILASAPAKTFAAGMADALATWIEGRKSYLTDGTNLSFHRASYTGYRISELSYDTIRKFGVQALRAVEDNMATSAVNNVIEASVWVSAVGAEAVGLTATHAIHNGLTTLPEFAGAQHGEIVAFAMIANLLLEGSTDEEIYDLANFIKELKLPLTLEDLGMSEWNEDDMRKVSEAATSTEDTMGNMTQNITPEDVYTAIKQANNVMQQVKDGYAYKF